MVFGKCTVVFRGFFWLGGGVGKRGLGGGNFPWRNFVMGEEDFHEGDATFSSIILKKIRK